MNNISNVNKLLIQLAGRHPSDEELRTYFDGCSGLFSMKRITGHMRRCALCRGRINDLKIVSEAWENQCSTPSSKENSASLDSYMVNGDRLPATWTRIFSRSFLSFRSTSHVAPDEWKSAWHQNMLKLQTARKKRDGIAVERIFIFDSIDEKERMEPTIQQHRQAGIDYYCVTKDVAESLKKGFPKVETFDFGVSDDGLLLEWELNASRRVKGARIRSIEQNGATDYIYYLDALRRSTQEHDCAANYLRCR